MLEETENRYFKFCRVLTMGCHIYSAIRFWDFVHRSVFVSSTAEDSLSVTASVLFPVKSGRTRHTQSGLMSRELY
jgi:hypothetical protein